MKREVGGKGQARDENHVTPKSPTIPKCCAKSKSNYAYALLAAFLA